ALEVLKRIDFLAEPAAGLRAGAAAHERLDLELGGEFVPQVLAAQMVHPAKMLLRREAHGNGGEEVVSLALALPVIFRAVIHVGRAARYGVEGGEGGDQLAASEHPHRN